MPAPIKGRGTPINPAGRFESRQRADFDDGWGLDEDPLPALETIVTAEAAKSIVARNHSPDIAFEASINPYRGCEHGCIYCYARPSHAFVNLSPGLDFETRLFYKPNAAALLETHFRKRRYRPVLISLGSNTDIYQPIEKTLLITRSLLEVLQRFRHPVALLTKGALIERDIDLLSDLARDRLCEVGITLTTLDPALKRSLEPRAASAAARLRAIRRLSEAGIPVRVMFSPVIPLINDGELEAVLAAAATAGARSASYVFLRLPHELKTLFRDWLQAHAPQKARHVMSLIQQSRGGADYASEFGTRMRGEGVFADLIAQRFELARRRSGLDADHAALDLSRFRVPPALQGTSAIPQDPQLGLF